MKPKRLWAGLLCAVLLLMMQGCAAAAPSSAAALPQTSSAPLQTLVVYTSHPPEIYAPLIAEFEERTGIWVDVVTGGTQELIAKMSDPETVPAADILFGGGVDSLEAAKELFEPYQCPETDALAEEVAQNAEGRWNPFSAAPLVLVYNTKLIGAKYAPLSWNSLLGSRWQGRIAFANPEISGSSYTALATMSQLYGADYIAEFAENLGGNLLESSGEALEKVADGTFPIGIAQESTVKQKMAEGANLNYVYPHDGTGIVPDGIAIAAGTEQPENARRFVDYMLSADVQAYLAQQLGRASVRADLAGAEPEALNNQWKMEYDIKAAAEEKEDLLRVWKTSYAAAQEGAS